MKVVGIGKSLFDFVAFVILSVSVSLFLYAFTGSGFTVQGYVVLTSNVGHSRLSGMKPRPVVRPVMAT